MAKADENDPFVLMERAKELARSQIEAARQKVAEAQGELDKLMEQFGGMLGMTTRPTRTPRQSSGPRGPRGERSASLLELIKANPDGLGRGAILEKLGVKGDKKQEAAVSAALMQLKKKGVIGSANGAYVPV